VKAVPPHPGPIPLNPPLGKGDEKETQKGCAPLHTPCTGRTIVGRVEPGETRRMVPQGKTIGQVLDLTSTQEDWNQP
jgi:hypothetical protein